MNTPASSPPPKASRWKNPLWLALVIFAVLAFLVYGIKTSGPAPEEAAFYEVKRGDFLISIVEGGTIEAVNEVSIRSEVEGTARIIYILPEGSYVKKGQLLVELDSSSARDAVNLQQINVEKAQFALVQSEQQLDIQKSLVDSEISAAELKVEFAQSDLDKFVKGEALQTRRDAQIEITNVIEQLQLAEETLRWTEELYKQNYESKSKLDSDRLSVFQKKLQLEQREKALWMIETFDEPKKKRELEATLQEAKDNLERVKLQGERKLAQYNADVQTQKSTLELNKSKLERDQKNLSATKILAPQDGLVVYAGGGDNRFSSESMIEEGAVIRNRQEIIKLPDTSEMKLRVKIHESHINQIQAGQPAFIVLDSMPDQRFSGEVKRVAPLPDSQSRWGNPNLKVYATEIVITSKLPDIKPGVSARAEIVITNLQNVVTVPIQAVTTRKGKQVVFLASAPENPVPVTIGQYNIKFIEIAEGLKEGDRVLLSPPFDSQDKDLAGSIVTTNDAIPAASPQTAAEANSRNDNGRPQPAITGEEAENNRNSGRGAGVPGDSEINRTGRGDRLPQFGQESGVAEGLDRSANRETRQRPNGAPGMPGGFNREEFIKQYDTNGDGQIDETERAAIKERFGGRDRPRRGSVTNAAPLNAAPPTPQ
ncbi:MAG TPA: efflux RND transporter periplasmic adaptor subunit [Candidatus Paceibacterota bacterium]|nr:efflux RND transporter periplasmic adaptor subunit [Candidatus Paceibacterota bacterium]